MKAREAAGEGSRLYIASSTLLDRKAFEEWRSFVESLVRGARQSGPFEEWFRALERGI